MKTCCMSARTTACSRVFDAKTGERQYQGRLADGRTGFSASPVASNGRLYFTSEEGDVYVIKAGPVFEQLAVESVGRGRDGDAGNFGRCDVLPDARAPGRGADDRQELKD